MSKNTSDPHGYKRHEKKELPEQVEAAIEATIAAVAGLIFVLLGWGTWAEGIIWIAFAWFGTYFTRCAGIVVSKWKIDHVLLVAIITFVFMGAGAWIDATHGTTGAVWIWTRIGFALAVIFAIVGYDMEEGDRFIIALIFFIPAGAGAGIGAIVGGIAGAAGAGDPATLASQWAAVGMVIGAHGVPVFIILPQIRDLDYAEAAIAFIVMVIGAIIGGICIAPAGGALGGAVLGYYYGTTIAFSAYLGVQAIKYYKQTFCP
jgi:hypothetical protein